MLEVIENWWYTFVMIDGECEREVEIRGFNSIFWHFRLEETPHNYRGMDKGSYNYHFIKNKNNSNNKIEKNWANKERNLEDRWSKLTLIILLFRSKNRPNS